VNSRSAFRVITPTGWYVVGVSVMGLLAALLWNWVEAWFIAGIGLSVLIFALPFLFGVRNYEIRVEAEGEQVVAGDHAAVTVLVENRSPRSQLPTVAELSVRTTRSRDGDETLALMEVALPQIAGHGVVEIPIEVPARDRGILALGPLTLTRRDPLGLLRREVSWRSQRLIHVHPKTVPLPPNSAGLIRDLEGQASRRLTDSDLSFHAIREYVPGDAVRHIHWKATAKAGGLMVRQFEESQAARIALLFDARADEYAGADEFELAVSVAASLSHQAVRSGREHLVVASRQGVRSAPTELPTHHTRELMDAWSELERASDAPRFEELSRSVAAREPGLSLVVLVTGSRPELQRIRRAAIAFPAEVRVLAVRCEELADPRAQRIDPLMLLSVGALGDLPGLMLRGAR